MAQIQVTEEYKKAVEAYEAAFGEKPPYCVKDPEYIMECVKRGEPSDHVPDPNACYWREGSASAGPSHALASFRGAAFAYNAPRGALLVRRHFRDDWRCCRWIRTRFWRFARFSRW